MTRQEIAVRMGVVACTLRTQLDEDDPISPKIVLHLCNLVDELSVVMKQFPICLELSNPAAKILAGAINLHVDANSYKHDELAVTTQCRAALLRIYEVLCGALDIEK
jgi:hypothetical protein